MESTVAETTEQASWWEDPIDVLFSPVELFRRRRHARLLVPLLMLLGAGVLVYIIMMPATDVIMRQGMAENPEAAAAMQQYGTVFRVVGAIFAPVGLFLVLAWAALLLWGFGRLADMPTTFSRTLLIAVYSAWVYIIAQILASILIMVIGSESVTDIYSALSFGLLRFIGTEGMPPTLVPLLGRLDVFVIWQAVLWAVGLSVFYNASRVRAAAVAIAVWVLAALPEILMATVRPAP